MTDVLGRIERFRGTHTWNEVVKRDTYRLKTLDFVPDVIYDIGANVGCFTVWAKYLFPSAHIVAVEPEDENYLELVASTKGLPGVTTIKGATGKPPIYFRRGQNSGGHSFVCQSPGYPSERLAAGERHTLVEIPAIDMVSLVYEHGGERKIIKIDVEGGEAYLLADPTITDALVTAEYITMELHPWSMVAVDRPAADKVRADWLEKLSRTHDVEEQNWKSGSLVWARKQ